MQSQLNITFILMCNKSGPDGILFDPRAGPLIEK